MGKKKRSDFCEGRRGVLKRGNSVDEKGHELWRKLCLFVLGLVRVFWSFRRNIICIPGGFLQGERRGCCLGRNLPLLQRTVVQSVGFNAQWEKTEIRCMEGGQAEALKILLVLLF